MSPKSVLGEPRPTHDELVSLGRERLVMLHNEAVSRLDHILKTYARNLNPSALRVLRFNANDEIDAIRGALLSIDVLDGLNSSISLSKTPSERVEHTTVEETADLFNILFDLKLSWLDDGAVGLDVSVAQELRKVCGSLKSKLLDQRVRQGIWTLTGNRTAIPEAFHDPSLLASLDLTAEEKQAILDEIRKPFSMYSLKRPRHFPRLTPEEAGEVFDLFLDVEESILNDAGLNQGSIAIIIDRLRRSKVPIVLNLIGDAAVLIGKYERAVQTLLNYADKAENTAAKRSQNAQSNVVAVGRSLFGAKEKIIGLATLWGDAVPLLLTRDWGIAGVISTTAGATVAAILPSGQRNTPKGRDAD